MTVAGHRHERIAGGIQEEIIAMLAGELRDPRLAGAATVSEVRVSPNLKQARVYVNVLGSEAEQAAVLEGLAAASGFIRHQLSVRLQLRRALEIIFILDSAEEYGQRIDDLLRRSKSPG
jgi:ribosome-binding factor A